ASDARACVSLLGVGGGRALCGGGGRGGLRGPRRRRFWWLWRQHGATIFRYGRPGGGVRPVHPTPTGCPSGSQRPSLCGRPREPLKNCLVAAQADVMLRGTLVDCGVSTNE